MTRSVFACLQLCFNSNCKLLEHIFKQAMESGSFLSEWEKGNILPIQKKDDKLCLKNYRPVSLLPICGKKFLKIIFNEMLNSLFKVNLFHPVNRDLNLTTPA